MFLYKRNNIFFYPKCLWKSPVMCLYIWAILIPSLLKDVSLLKCIKEFTWCISSFSVYTVGTPPPPNLTLDSPFHWQNQMLNISVSSTTRNNPTPCTCVTSGRIYSWQSKPNASLELPGVAPAQPTARLCKGKENHSCLDAAAAEWWGKQEVGRMMQRWSHPAARRKSSH